jgi:hypothetical protein
LVPIIFCTGCASQLAEVWLEYEASPPAEPPYDDPPADEPRADEPPYDEPPYDEPPADEPAYDEPLPASPDPPAEPLIAPPYDESPPLPPESALLLLLSADDAVPDVSAAEGADEMRLFEAQAVRPASIRMGRNFRIMRYHL